MALRLHTFYHLWRADRLPGLRRRLEFIRRHPLTSFMFFMIGLLFCLLIFLFFNRVFQYMISLPDFTRPFVLGFIQRLLTALLTALTFLVFLSASLNTLSIFYLNDDTEIHRVLPVPASYFILSRSFSVFSQSTYMVFLTLIPVILAFFHNFNIQYKFLPLHLLILSFYFLILVLTGQICTALLVRWFPVRRLHQFILFLTTLVLITFFLILRLARPERFLKPFDPGDLMALLQQLTLPGARWWPQSWVSTLMIDPFLQTGWNDARQTAIAGFVFLGLVIVPLWTLFTRLYTRTWFRARETLSQFRTQKRQRILTSSSLTSWLLIRDWWFFSRDPTQWGQFMLLSAVILIYFFNIRLIPIPHPSIVYFIWLLNTAMTGFILSALCARFVLPAYSQEGKSSWVLYVLPIRPEKVFNLRSVYYSVIFTVLTVGMSLGSLSMLGLLDFPFILVNLLLVLSITLPITLIAMNFGVRFRSSSETSPLQMALKAPGVIFMLVSMLWIILAIFMTLPWVWFWIRRRFFDRPAPDWPNLLLLSEGLITLISSLWLFRDGRQRSARPVES